MNNWYSTIFYFRQSKKAKKQSISCWFPRVLEKDELIRLTALDGGKNIWRVSRVVSSYKHQEYFVSNEVRPEFERFEVSLEKLPIT